MNIYEIILGILTAVVTICIVALLLPFSLRERSSPFTVLGTQFIGAASAQDISGRVAAYAKDIPSQYVMLRFEEESQEFSLSELGIQIDPTKTAADALTQPFITFPQGTVSIRPTYSINEAMLYEAVHARFGQKLLLPKDATLVVTSGLGLALQKSAPGQRIDTAALVRTLRESTMSSTPIDLTIITGEPDVQDSEVEQARAFAQILLSNGFVLTFDEEDFTIQPSTVRRMLEFKPVSDNSGNKILGVTFNEAELTAYLERTIVPEVDQEAIDARFEVVNSSEGPIRVSQFATAERGQKIDVAATVRRIEEALIAEQGRVDLVVHVTEPAITSAEDMERLGIKTLLAQGESDFKGSPNNRVHNIRIGADKYNGILIAPGEEFSFLKYLGPVTAEAGFKPELVIKNNVTTPEFGGGLCQVSSTAFRAAINSGLEITERRNHSYAVSYYGTPGFDATIYPPYTDLRFLNNTPGYILVQTKIIGTRLLFDFWGTEDGRHVEVVGPSPYNRQSNGAVKATLQQIVTKDGAVMLEDTFYSNYKSPELFPKVLAANGEAPPGQPTPNASQNPTPTPTNPPPKN